MSNLAPGVSHDLYQSLLDHRPIHQRRYHLRVLLGHRYTVVLQVSSVIPPVSAVSQSSQAPLVHTMGVARAADCRHLLRSRVAVVARS
jgi:uncharacterized protein YqiB (DUF1249 family)